MRRIALFVLVLGLIAGVIMLAPAQGKPKAKPVPTTLYFHGGFPAGEIDEAKGLVDQTFMSMDTTKPSSPAPASKTLGWANTACAGHRGFLVWVGKVSGKITGDLKFTFTSVSNPEDVDIRVWADVDTLLCNGDYIDPWASKTVTLPAGMNDVEAVIPNVNIHARSTLMVQISPTQQQGTDWPGPGRILYDSPDAPSRVEFSCVPSKGSACS
jgi:hypothetical protein